MKHTPVEKGTSEVKRGQSFSGDLGGKFSNKNEMKEAVSFAACFPSSEISSRPCINCQYVKTLFLENELSRSNRHMVVKEERLLKKKHLVPEEKKKKET